MVVRNEVSRYHLCMKALRRSGYPQAGPLIESLREMAARLAELDTRELHQIERALLHAPASSCNSCPLKASCTPHDEGRHLYRFLAAWAETDIGRFHRRLSLLMVGIGVIFSLGGLGRWMGHPGTGLLLLALAASLASVARDLRAAWAGPEAGR